MDAYAVFSGGGVKGAALAGCLRGAEQCGIHFRGYAGTSAGSIIALLAAVGYSGNEIRRLTVRELDFSLFFEDEGTRLSDAKELVEGLSQARIARTLTSSFKAWNLYKNIRDKLGLYDGKKLEFYLSKKIKDKVPDLESTDNITFSDLDAAGCEPLKILATDVVNRCPHEYSLEASGRTTSVVEAVRASISYPFVFEPVTLHDRQLVDGGLCSNLPLHLFSDEWEQRKLPIIAFDLKSNRRTSTESYTLRRYMRDLIEAALGSSEKVIQQNTKGLYHIAVDVPKDIGTFEHGLARSQKEHLCDTGENEALRFFQKQIPQWQDSEDLITRFQALHSPAYVVEPVLKAFANEVGTQTGAERPRASLLLPTAYDSLLTVYQYGMENHTDEKWEVGKGTGCAGAAWEERRPVPADLEMWREGSYSGSGLGKGQVSTLDSEVKARYAFPILFPFESVDDIGEEDAFQPFGILAVDSTSPLSSTGWLTDRNRISRIGKTWADISWQLLS